MRDQNIRDSEEESEEGFKAMDQKKGFKMDSEEDSMGGFNERTQCKDSMRGIQ